MDNYEYKTSAQLNKIVKTLIESENIDEIAMFCANLEEKGTTKKFELNAIDKLNKFIEDDKLEHKRLFKMMKFENELYDKGIEYIIGIDEVGRGCFAGPVTVGAVILPKNEYIKYLNDSKKLSEKKRNIVNDNIIQKATDYVICSMTNNDIDEKGIRNCVLMLMRECVLYFVNKGYENIHVLVDAETIPNIEVPQTAIIKGDSKSVSIAGASIIAKAYRNKLMKEMGKIYTEYGFETNDGYGSTSHIDAIIQYGICPIHRKSYVKSALNNKNIKEIGTKYNIALF